MSRFFESESPDIVLDRLRAKEPRWIDHPKTGTHPEAAGLSAANETREEFQRRHAAWAAAVAREEQRKKEERSA